MLSYLLCVTLDCLTELGLNLDFKSFVSEVDSHNIVNIELGSHFHIEGFGGTLLTGKVREN